MSPSLQNLDRLAVALRKPVQELGVRLQAEFGSAIVNWSIFGEAATGTFDRAYHTVRNTLVVQQVNLEAVRRLAGQGSQFGKARIAAPLLLTTDFIHQSLDTYPLELLEIQQQNIRLLGQELFRDLTFVDEHVRLHCEREMKTVQLALHQGLLSSHGQSDRLAGVVHHVIERLSRTLRGWLWLKGRKKYQPLSDIVQTVSQLTQLPVPGMLAAVQTFTSPSWDTFCRLYAEVTALEKIINDA